MAIGIHSSSCFFICGVLRTEFCTILEINHHAKSNPNSFNVTNKRISYLLSSGFYLSVESNFNSLWSCITTLINCFKNSRHFLNQSEVKPKPIFALSHTFSRASCRLHVFASCFDWFTGLPVSFVIGQSDSFDFGLTAQSKIALSTLS